MPVPISNVTRRAVYAPSGAGGAGPYAFTFEILAAGDIAVYKDDVLLTLTTHYTVTINANGTGSVTITAAGLALAPASPTQYAIVGNRTIARTTDFTTGGDFFANTLNDELDQQTIFAQQNSEGLQRALQAPQTDPTSINMTLPRSSDRAGRYLAFDSSGNPTVASDLTIVYQGAKASNPTVRNGGQALQPGDIYFNTNDVGLRVYTGTAWVVAVNATDPLVEVRFLATAGQTSATFTGGYRVGFLYVFVNGVMLDTTDITATNGTTVTFASALALNDEVRMITFKSAASLSATNIGALAVSNNLSDVASASTARTNLGLGALATKATVAATDIDANAVTTAKIADANITTAKIADANVTIAKLASDVQVALTGFKNRIINGDMRIDQRNAGASVTPASNDYTLDRWQAALTQTSKFTIQRNAGSVTPPAGFTNYLGVTSSSAYSVLTSDFFLVRQKIEGFNVADFGWGAAGAQTVTLSFWVRSSLTGTFGGAIYNAAGTRSYPFSYTISAANTWEQKTITIAGDTTGTWATDNGASIQVSFNLGAGSTYSGTAGAWSGSFFTSATGATSVVGTNGATFYITGVQLEAGSVATPFERRDYGRELIMCQRYFEFSNNWQIYSSQVVSGNTYYDAVRFSVTKRASPVVTPTTVAVLSFPGGSPSAPFINVDGFYAAGTANATNVGYYQYSWTAAAEL